MSSTKKRLAEGHKISYGVVAISDKFLKYAGDETLSSISTAVQRHKIEFGRTQASP